jgi:hypothetical protein
MRRYVLLSYCMAMRTVSFRVKKRFPDLQHLVDAGLMREDELKVEPVFLNVYGAQELILRHYFPPAYLARRAGTITLFLLAA